jgi:hypothetical protein
MSNISVLSENINAPSGLTKLLAQTINSFVRQVEGDVAEGEQRIRVASALKELAATVISQILISTDCGKVRSAEALTEHTQKTVEAIFNRAMYLSVEELEQASDHNEWH